MNPMDMVKAMMGKISPQQMILKMVGQNTNPIIANALQMAEKGDQKGLENIARNMCKEKGMDFDKEFKDFMNNFK